MKGKPVQRLLVVLDREFQKDLGFEAVKILQKAWQAKVTFLIVLHENLQKILSLDLKQVIEETRKRFEVHLPPGAEIAVEVGDLRERVLIALEAYEADILVFFGIPDTRHMKVIRSSPKPVWVIHPEKPFPGENIGVPLALKPRDQLALDWAQNLKEAFGGRVLGLRFYSVPGRDFIASLNLADSLEEVDQQFAAMQRQEIEAFLKEIRRQTVLDEVIVEQDSPKSGIVRAVEEHDIGVLIMTLRKPGVLEQLFFGTVTEAVLHHLPTHILVVPVEQKA